jgi:hypothetical protein
MNLLLSVPNVTNDSDRSVPPSVIPLALGVAPPSDSSSAPAPFAAPDAEALSGEERKKRGDCVCVEVKR